MYCKCYGWKKMNFKGINLGIYSILPNDAFIKENTNSSKYISSKYIMLGDLQMSIYRSKLEMPRRF